MEAKEYYLNVFEANQENLTEGGPEWLTAARREAIAGFERSGFPARRDEQWRHTNLTPITRQDFQLAEPGLFCITAKQVGRGAMADSDAFRIAFVNGFFDRNLSSLDGIPDGVQIEAISGILHNDPARLKALMTQSEDAGENAFAALNAAFAQDGAFVSIPEGIVLEKPVHLFYYSVSNDMPSVSHPRTVIIAGKNSRCSIVERYAGAAGRIYWTNAQTNVSIAENAVVEHCKLQRESHDAFHISHTRIELARDSRYTHHNISLGGGLTRNGVTASLNDEGIECALNGFTMLDGERHCDNHTLIVHDKPHGRSHELYKSILDGRSSTVFQGKIYVEKDAQKTDAEQTNQTLLLSGDATIDSMPQLEIYADDVKCSHGSTTGQLDEDAIFYLQARGIEKEAARGLLTYAFANEVIQRIGIDTMREELDRLLLQQLPTV